VTIRARVKNELQHLCLNQGVQRKHKLWSQAGQKVLRELPLKPWAARRREDLLGLLAMLDQQIDPLDRAVKEEAQRDKMALLLQTTHEIDRPTLIRPHRCRIRRRSIPADPPALPYAHRQAFLSIQPVHPLMIDLYPLAHQHRRQPPIPEPHSLPRQLLQARSQCSVSFRSAPSIPLRRSCQSHQPAGVSLARLTLDHDVTRGCPWA
jgi:hypothetical protein